MICQTCGNEGIFTICGPNTIHYGRIDCPLCRKWICFVPKPGTEEIRKETSSFTISGVVYSHKMQKEFCFFCLRDKDQLGTNEVLTLDHIQELSKGGKDELENLQILCTACHKLKNWARLYMNWHLNNT